MPDALAGVPAAGLDRAPLRLLKPNCMPTATCQEIDRLQPSTIVVLGGPATVSDAAVNGASCAPPPTDPTPPPTAPPAQPADRDCADFTTQADAQAFYDVYFPYYGDFARLDGNDDGIACNNLP